VNVQSWLVSGYEATGEIEDEPTEGTPLHRGVNFETGDTIWVLWDESLHRWQEVDVDLLRRQADAEASGEPGVPGRGSESS
jgi:hypothetical protein